MALQRATRLYLTNTTTVDSGSGIDIRALSATEGTDDNAQSIRNNTQGSSSERTFDPATDEVLTVANATAIQGEGWAVPLADMSDGDARCTTRLPAGEGALRLVGGATGTGSGGVGANDVWTPRMSLWKWNTSTNTGTLIVSASGTALTLSALLAYGPTAFDQTIDFTVPLTTFAANEVLFVQAGGLLACGAGLLGGARTFRIYLGVDNVSCYIDFYGAGGLRQRCDLAPTGAIVPTSAIIKRPTKAFAGAVAPTAVIVRNPTRLFASNITPTSQVIRKPSKFLTSTLPSSSTLIRRPGLLLDGHSLTPGPSSITMKPTKLLVSNITPTSTLNFFIRKFFTGTITPSGTALKRPTKYLTSNLTPGPSTVVRRPTKLLTSNITPTAIIRTLLTKNFRSTLPLSGAMIRTVSKSFTGTITPLGHPFRTVKKFFTGYIGPEGGGVTVVNIFRRVFIDD